MAEGRIVTLHSSSYSTPPVCCSCGAPQQTTIATKQSKGRAGGGSTTLTMNFPYCQPCADRAKAFKSKQVMAVLIALAASAVVAGLVFAIPALPMVAAIVVAAVIGIGGTIGAAVGMKPKDPPLPATAAGEAVRILSFKPGGGQTQLYCSNATWAEHFARANNAPIIPKSKTQGFLAGPIVVAFIAAPIAAVACWMGAHPTVHVDNPSSEAMQIWLDGNKAMVVEANGNGSLDVGYGKHTFGWSKTDVSSPSSTVDGDVHVGDDHLYNPGKTGCYWLVADAYGSASTAGLQKGPQPIQEFYHFDKVDTWFGDNPQSIEVGSHESGGTRVALQRAKMCMETVKHGCPVSVREQLVTCQRAATTDDAFDKCGDEAIAACKGALVGAGGPAVPVAATAPKAGGVAPKYAPKPVAKPAPKPAPKK